MKFRSRFTALTLALALSISAPIFTGCAAKAAVSSTPTASDQQAVRNAAARAADGIKTGLEIARAAGRFIDTLSIPAADKNAFDSAIVAVTGTTARPGPLVAALDAMASATSEASLKASVNTSLTVIDPLVAKLEASSNLGIAGFGASMRAATLFARNYVSGGVR